MASRSGPPPVPDSFTGRPRVLRRVGGWLRDPSGGSLLITGDPGAGKTEFAAHLVRIARGEDPSPGELDGFRLHAAHFCRVRVSDSISGDGVVRSLSAQLAESVPGYLRVLADQAGDAAPREFILSQRVGEVSGGTVEMSLIRDLHLAAHNHRQTYNVLIRRPLRALSESGALTGAVVVLVDGIDEARSSDHGRLFLDLLEAELTEPVPGLRWLLLGRSKPVAGRIARHLNARIDLHADRLDDTDDIRSYVEARLGDRPRLAARIAGQAQGNFLYAYFVTEEILAGRRDPGPALPHGLIQVYEDFLDREVRADRDRWASVVRPVLSALAVGYGEGLTRRQLHLATGLPPAAVADAIRLCGPYLRAQSADGPFRLYHDSLRAHLLSPSRTAPSATSRPGDDIAEPAERHIDPASARTALVKGLYGAHSGRWRECDDPYVLKYLLEHIVDALDEGSADLGAAFAATCADPGFLCAVMADDDMSDAFVLALSRARRSGDARVQHAADDVYLIVSRQRASMRFNVRDFPFVFLCHLAHLAHLASLTGFAAAVDDYLDRHEAAGLRTLWSTDHRMHVVGALTAGMGREFASNVLTIVDDGRLALGGFADGTVCLWNVATGVRRYSAHVHEAGVSALAVTSDEATGVSGGYDGSLCVWEVETGEIVHRLRPSDPSCVAWTAGGDGSYHMGSGAASMVGRILVAPDDRTVIAGAGTDVELWDLETGELLAALTGQRHLETDELLAPEQEHLVVHLVITEAGDLVTVDGMRCRTLWPEASGLLRDRLRDRRPQRRDHLVSTDFTAVHLHDPATGEHVASFPAADDTPERPAVTPDGGFVVVPAPDNSYVVRAVPGGEVVGGFESDRTLKCHIVDWRAENIAVSVPGGYVLEGLMNGVVRVHHLGSEDDLRGVPPADTVSAVAFTRDGRTAITASYDSLEFWDVDTGTCTRHKYTDVEIQRSTCRRDRRTKGSAFSQQISAMAVTPDGGTLVGGWTSGAVTLWDVRSGERTGILLEHQPYGQREPIEAVGTGDDLVTAVSYTSVRAWRPSDGRELFNAVMREGNPIKPVITPTGGHALLPHANDFQVWEIATGTLIAELTGALARYRHVGDSYHLSPDGRTAVLCGDEIEIWDLAESRLLHRLPDPRRHYDRGKIVLREKSTTLSRSGRLLLAYDGRRTLTVLDLEHAAELDHLTFEKAVSDCVVNPARETEFMVTLVSGEVVYMRQAGLTS